MGSKASRSNRSLTNGTIELTSFLLWTCPMKAKSYEITNVVNAILDLALSPGCGDLLGNWAVKGWNSYTMEGGRNI